MRWFHVMSEQGTWQYMSTSVNACCLPGACAALHATEDDEGCNPVVEAELPALLSLIIVLGCRYFARPALVCFHFSSLADQSTPVLTPRQPHLSISNRQSSINHFTSWVCQHHHHA
jgi:hypothetical protein